MKIEENGDRISVYTPYNQDFVDKIRNVGGSKWDAGKRCWTAPTAAITAIREIMLVVYGESDIDSEEKVSIRVTFNDTVSVERGDVILFGKTICHASYRDSGGRAGDDVFYVSGKPQSGGSAKYWKSVVPSGSIVTVANVPLSKIGTLENEDYSVVIVRGTDKNQKLREEKERLLKRIAEIDDLLLSREVTA
jgi:hypothetical protein